MSSIKVSPNNQRNLVVLSVPNLKIEDYKFNNPYDLYVMKFIPQSLENIDLYIKTIINTAKAFDCEKIIFKVCETMHNYDDFLNELEDHIRLFNLLQCPTDIEAEVQTGFF